MNNGKRFRCKFQEFSRNNSQHEKSENLIWRKNSYRKFVASLLVKISRVSESSFHDSNVFTTLIDESLDRKNLVLNEIEVSMSISKLINLWQFFITQISTQSVAK